MSDEKKEPSAEDTVPGLSQDAEGGLFIGKAASQHSLDLALADQQKQMDKENKDINEELASGRAPGSEAGSDQPDSKKGSGS